MVPNLKANEIQLEWQYGGTTCHGRFVPAPNVMVLQFMLKTAVITATYRIVDANSTDSGGRRRRVAAVPDLSRRTARGCVDGTSDGRVHRRSGGEEGADNPVRQHVPARPGIVYVPFRLSAQGFFHRGVYHPVKFCTCAHVYH